MKGYWNLVGTLTMMALSVAASAQQPSSGGRGERSEAQRSSSGEAWTISGRTWDFKDIAAAYEPVRGHLEGRNGEGDLAVWKLKLTKDFEEGAQRFHDEVRGSPFKVVLLDQDRTTINPDLPATITPVPSRKDDTIELYIALPNRELLRDVKYIRVQRRTDVGF